MDHELFWISGSPYSWRVQLALEYKGVPYVSRRLDTGKQEHRSPAFLALNPRGKAPVLKTGDAAICESVAIIAFLDRVHPAVPLFGRTAPDHGRIWKRVFEFENYARDPIDVEIVRPLLRGHAKENAEAMRASAGRVHDAVGCMDQALSSAPYPAGDDITAADIVALPNIQLLRRVAARPQATEMALGWMSSAHGCQHWALGWDASRRCGATTQPILHIGGVHEGGQRTRRGALISASNNVVTLAQ